MPRRIVDDHKKFRDIIDNKFRKALKKHIKNNKFVKDRPKNGKLVVNMPEIHIPHIVFGESDEGTGRGPGKKGDVIGKDPQPGDGGGAGQEQGEGIEIQVDLDYFLDAVKDELSLPDLKPKPNETFEEIKIKYNDIALHGPESLRHNKRTMLQALKRLAATKELDKLQVVQGSTDLMRVITPINSDRRYRQYKEIKLPSSNAVIFYMRDWSGSMDNEKCDIVSDVSWWLDLWIRRYYKRVESVYIGHDVVAEEVSQDKFYKYRYGGGTTCSSAFKFVVDQFENRFPPSKWNIYVFYFTDGDNWGGDNEVVCNTIKNEMPSGIVNFVGITQILSWSYKDSLKSYIDNTLKVDNIKTVSIGPENNSNPWNTTSMSEDDRNEAVRRVIKDLLGAANK